MAISCAHCHKPLSLSKVTGSRGKGFSSQIQCYHCKAWLGRHAKLTMLKVIGFYTAVIAAVVGYFIEGTSNIVTPTILLSLILMGVSHMMDHLLVMELPVDEES
ncbi:hypothetical protein L2735_11300 [Shewanella olleyana]|uniref:hypothetical protein n=1 Tax=Shewanella olleyana TaxID=135626 RepID=UPI00200D0938|nr:hypothetical protein [Shewanella olleyana]MCL1067391.1 hypothetical protein [Shewanella olleyana]